MLLEEGVGVPADEPVTIDGHTFQMERDVDPHDFVNTYRWRWVCWCPVVDGKVHGQWNYQSPNVAYPAWRNHVKKAGKK